MPDINEWTLTADIAKWIAEILRDRVDLPFSDAKVEERGEGSLKRRDITVYHRDGRKVLTGELKMPDSPQGRSPFQDSLVMDAHEKADAIGVQYFFTCNVNRCVLWRTFERGTPLADRHVAFWNVLPAPVRRSEEVAQPRVQEQIRQFLAVFLERCAAITSEQEPMPSIPLDEKFLWVWEAALEQPVAQTLRAISERYEKDAAFTSHLVKWMRDEQKWTISRKDEDVIRENLERAAKLSCYVLANRVIFYKALRRRFPRMRALQVHEGVTTGEELKELLDEYFSHAIRISRDYETVFAADYGDTLPFLNDDAVGSWRDLVRQTDGFDFTGLNYEIIGQIFERMLSTDERHKFGQHYTRSEVVDLINAFCVRDANATVLDPACGGGTFLVRAYARKRDLSNGGLTHQDLLRQLHGLDISSYPAHLTTINLATRDLIDRANYPLVAQRDFFKVGVGDPIFHLPLGRADGQLVTLQIEKVDAVVGNPPYVRQEKITEYHGKKYKARLRDQAQRDAPGSQLSGRSDIHCYFFTHGSTFLGEGGYLGLLTSSTWLDTTYGFRLQNFFLDNFEVIAIFESNCEPWFTGARVTTAAVILRKQPDPEKRAANNVKFVWLTKPLADLLTYASTEEDRRLTFEELRERVEEMTGGEGFTLSLSGSEPITVRQETLDGVRVRIVNQGDLYRLGCATIPVTEADESEASDEAEEGSDNGEWNGELPAPNASTGYVGYKWGIFLRAPDIFFKLLKRGGSAFVPLGNPEVATIRRGVTTGCDTFFFPRDVTDQALSALPDPAEFKRQYGISPRQADRVRIVRAGDGTRHLVERQYLEPVVFNLMEIDSAEINEQRLHKCILLVDKPKDQLRGTHVLKYIRWGEREGFDDGPTCASREKWYTLEADNRSDVFWSKSFRYRHIAPFNRGKCACNCNLYDIWAAPGVSGAVLCALLNSTVVALSKHQFGRMMGGDPMLKTEVVDVKMMLVPDPHRATEKVRERLEATLDSLRRRTIGHLVDVDGEGEGLTGELAMPDRHELDDAVLELLGIDDPAERRKLRAELYAEITKLHRAIRAAEKRMQKFRSETARRGRPSAHSLAAEIWEKLDPKPPHLTLLDFAANADCEQIDLPEGKARAVNDLWNQNCLSVAGRLIPLNHPSRVRFAKALCDTGVSGRVAIPNEPEAADAALRQYEEHLRTLEDSLTALAADYTADEAMQQRILRQLRRLIRNARP